MTNDPVGNRRSETLCRDVWPPDLLTLGRTVPPSGETNRRLARLFSENQGAAQSCGKKGVALGRRERGIGAALRSLAGSSQSFECCFCGSCD